MAEVTKLKEGQAVSVFERLSKIDTSNLKKEKMGKHTYLAWADAWATVKKACPDTSFQKHTFEYNHPENGIRQLPYMMDQFGYAYVQCTVSIEGIDVTETYMVLAQGNKAVTAPTSFQVNTALQRCLTKCLAYHGFGIHIYRGEEFVQEEG